VNKQHDTGLRRVGLARALSKLGLCSRSRAAELVRSGEVRLNGTVRHDPETPVRLGKDHIEIAGKTVKAGFRIYLMMNKPRGVVTTASDEKGRETVYAYLDESLPWVAPVGRLDKASEGLLLLTNDSEWAGTVTAPESQLDKTYHVQVGTVAGAELLEAMVKGVKSNGEVLRVKSAGVLRGGEKNSWLEVVLDEGRNRQIRRILEAMQIEVMRLVRVSVGPLRLGDLKKGEVRRLRLEEKAAVDRAMKSV